MINWLKKFKYISVDTQTITTHFTDTDRRCYATVIFQQNGFGKRRLLKAGSLYPQKINEHPYWVKHAIPWREYTLKHKDAPEKKINPDTSSNVIPFRNN